MKTKQHRLGSRHLAVKPQSGNLSYDALQPENRRNFGLLTAKVRLNGTGMVHFGLKNH